MQLPCWIARQAVDTWGIALTIVDASVGWELVGGEAELVGCVAPASPHTLA